MDIGCASQVSYPVFEIVSEVLKTCRPFTMETVTENNQPYQLASVKIGGIPVHFTVQNKVNSDDPDNFMHYLFMLELITVHGRLRLDDVMGGVYWYNKMFVPVHGTDASLLESEGVLSANSCTELCKPEEKGFNRIFTEEWITGDSVVRRFFYSFNRSYGSL